MLRFIRKTSFNRQHFQNIIPNRHKITRMFQLVFITRFIIVSSVDLEVPQFILVLGACYYTDVVAEIVLLEELLCKILQVPVGK